MRVRLLLFPLALAVVAGVGTPGRTAAEPAVSVAAMAMPFEKFTLSNGLEVILHEDHRAPVVTVNVWYHVGSKDEPAGRNGFAHLFEHVMFQGSRNVAEDTFFKYLERAGASDKNGTTNTDRTNYYETVPSNQLPLALWLESDRMGFLLDHAGEETFKSQREVVKNERRQNYENAPYGMLWMAVNEAMYPKDHPYHLLTIGTPEDLDRASVDDVKTFFKTYYVPTNATLVVAGDMDREKTKALVSKYFSSIPGGVKPAVKKDPIVVTLTGEKKVHMEAEVELPRLHIAWPTPAEFTPGDGELDLVSKILSSGMGSRLHKRLVYDLQIAQSANAWQSSALLGSQFGIAVTLKKGKSLDEALKIVDEELDKLRSAEPSVDEVDRGKVGLLSQLYFSMERVNARADAFNHYNQSTGDPGYFSKDVARYEKLSAADVKAAIAKYLPKEKRVVVFVKPTVGAPRAGKVVSREEAPSKAFLASLSAVGPAVVPAASKEVSK